MPSNAMDPQPYRKYEFELYQLWRVLTMRAKNSDLRRFPSWLRNDHQLHWTLKGIKTQAEFAKRYGIKDPGTLTDWNTRIDDPRKFFAMQGTEYHRLQLSLARRKRLAKKIEEGNKKDAQRIIPARPEPPPMVHGPGYRRRTPEERRKDSYE